MASKLWVGILVLPLDLVLEWADVGLSGSHLDLSFPRAPYGQCDQSSATPMAAWVKP